MNLSRHELKPALEDIIYLTNELQGQFKIQAEQFITNLKGVLDKNLVSTTDIKSNSFDFKFWSLDFIVKTEVLFNSRNFSDGELNTYLRRR